VCVFVYVIVHTHAYLHVRTCLYLLGSVDKIKCGPAENLNILNFLVLMAFKFSVSESFYLVDK
jgi:hypothetical protein